MNPTLRETSLRIALLLMPDQASTTTLLTFADQIYQYLIRTDTTPISEKDLPLGNAA